jgi:hypothetical protein
MPPVLAKGKTQIQQTIERRIDGCKNSRRGSKHKRLLGSILRHKNGGKCTGKLSPLGISPVQAK